MADDLAVEFFKTARSQCEQTTRWHLIVLAALLYFHVGIVAPFAAKSAERAAIDHNLAQQRAVAAAVAPVARLTKDLADKVDASAKEVSGALLSDLVERFGKLHEVVATLTGMGEEEAAGQAGEMLFSQPVQQQMQQGRVISLQPMPADLRRTIAHYGTDASAVFQYQGPLTQYIQEFVIAPSFDQANAVWKEQLVPAIDDDIKAVTAAIAEARTKTGDAAAEFTDMEKKIEGLRSQVDSLQFTVPADTGWWRTVAEKEGSIQAMIQTLVSGIRDAARSQVNLSTLQQKAEETARQQEVSAQAVGAELKRLEDENKALQSQLGEFGGPLKIVAFPLATAAPLLPLIIAVASGIATLLTAEALRKMRLAVSLATASDQAKLNPWLADIAGLSLSSLTVRAILLAALMAGWILWALRATLALKPLFLSATTIAAIALVLLLACRLWLWLQATQALRQARGRLTSGGQNLSDLHPEY